MSRRSLSRVQLAQLLEVDERFVVLLEEHEIVRSDRDGRYDAMSLERVRVCWTMHHSLGVNLAGLEVALDLLDRWQGERRRVHRLLRELRDARGER